MYSVKYGNDYLFDPYGEKDEKISNARLSAEINASAYFDFTISSDHRLYDKIAERDKIVKLYSDDKLLFMGEITDIQEDFYGSKDISCVDPRDHLGDIMLRPYSTLEGEQPILAPSSIEGYFQWLIDQYNNGGIGLKFKFDVGVNQGAALSKTNYIHCSSSSYPTVASEIENNILDQFGGYLTLTYPNDQPTLNLYADVHESNTQIIDFGVNLLDFAKTTTTDKLYTVVRPEGGTPKSEDGSTTQQEPVTIESLPDGTTTVDSDYVKMGDVVYNIQSVNRYGYREYNYTNTNVLTAQDLLEDAVKDLKKVVEPRPTIEVKAVDLALFMDGYNHLDCGVAARVRSKPHNVDEYLLVSSIDIDLMNPGQTTYTLGQAYNSLTGEQSSFVKSLNAGINSSYDAVADLDQTVKDQAVTIDGVQQIANQANDTANSAKTAAENAQTDATNAAKIATNYLKFDSSGLCVGNMTGTLGYNTLIKSNGVDIRNGSTVLASFSPSNINIGISSDESSVQFCDDSFRIIAYKKPMGSSGSVKLAWLSSTNSSIKIGGSKGLGFSGYTNEGLWFEESGDTIVASNGTAVFEGNNENVPTFRRSLIDTALVGTCIKVKSSADIVANQTNTFNRGSYDTLLLTNDPLGDILELSGGSVNIKLSGIYLMYISALFYANVLGDLCHYGIGESVGGLSIDAQIATSAPWDSIYRTSITEVDLSIHGGSPCKFYPWYKCEQGSGSRLQGAELGIIYLGNLGTR